MADRDDDPMDAHDTATKQLWTRGSYAIVGDWFADASRACLDDLDLDGTTLLDVACGTGAVAIEAARRGAAVVGVDLTPHLLSEARRRADAAGLDIEWHEGSFTDLSAYDGFDVVTSAFGAMFAEDQPAVAAELLRSVRPDGVVVIAAWAPGSAFAYASPTLLDLLPGPPQGLDRTRWATEDGLTSLCDDVEALDAEVRVSLERVTTATVGLAFDSVEDAVVQMRRWSGPWMMMFDALEAVGNADAGHAALIDQFAGYADPTPEGIRLDAAYTVAHLHRR